MSMACGYGPRGARPQDGGTFSVTGTEISAQSSRRGVHEGVVTIASSMIPRTSGHVQILFRAVCEVLIDAASSFSGRRDLVRENRTDFLLDSFRNRRMAISPYLELVLFYWFCFIDFEAVARPLGSRSSGRRILHTS
jgi:hypothetical protein